MDKKEEDKLRANIIRELKKSHPKGFCYICGKGKRATLHHLREINHRNKGKVKGIIPLCRDCHNAIESMKRFVKLKQAYKRGQKDLYDYYFKDFKNPMIVERNDKIVKEFVSSQKDGGKN